MATHYDLPPLEYLTKFMSWFFHTDGNTIFRINFCPTELFSSVDDIINCYQRLNNLINIKSHSYQISFQLVHINFEFDGINHSINLPIQCLDITKIGTKNTVTIKPIINNVTMQKFGKKKLCIINVDMTNFLTQLENMDGISIPSISKRSASFVY